MAKTLAQLKTIFDNFETPLLSKFNTFKSEVHESQMYWMILPLEPYIKAFQATKDFAYLNKALDVWWEYQSRAYTSNSMPNSQLPARSGTTSGTDYNDDFLTWDSHGQMTAYPIGASRNGGEAALYQTHGGQCIPLLLSVLYHNSTILSTAHGNATWTAGYNEVAHNGGADNWGTTYQDVLDSILSFFEQNVWNKWDLKYNGGGDLIGRGAPTVGLDELLFRGQVHIASHASNMALYLWKITGTQKYKDFLDDWNFDCDGHGYNSSTTAGFEEMIRAHNYTDMPTTYNGFVWDNTWTSGASGETDTNHWNAEFRHVANQMMFPSDYWTGKTIDGRDFVSGMVATARWGIDNADNGGGNYRPLLTPSTKAGKIDGSSNIRTGAYYYGVVCWGRFDATLQEEIEDSVMVNAAPSSNGHRNFLLTANAMYNRAYLDGSPMFMEIPTDDPITAITFDTDIQTLYDGDTANLAVTLTPVSPSDGTYSIASNNLSVVDNAGNFVGIGTATLTVTATDTTNGTIEDTMAVTCSATAVTGVSVSPSSYSILVLGTVQLNTLFTPTTSTDKTGSWVSDDVGVATVNSSTGLVTGVALGTCVITFTANDTTNGTLTDTCNITVAATITDPISILNPLVFYTPESIDPAVTVDGNAISVWQDTSGNGLNATVVGGVTLNVSGTRQVEFDGTGWLDVADDASLELIGGTNEFTMIFREGDVRSLTSGYVISKAKTGSFTVQYGVAYGSGTFSGVYIGHTLSGLTNTPINNNRLCIVRVSTTSVDMWVDGIQTITGGAVGVLDAPLQSLNIGGRTDGSYLMDAGSQLDLVAIIPSAISTPEREAIESTYVTNTAPPTPGTTPKRIRNSTSSAAYYVLNSIKRFLK
jgi:uncharacterized protein YjdB